MNYRKQFFDRSVKISFELNGKILTRSCLAFRWCIYVYVRLYKIVENFCKDVP